MLEDYSQHYHIDQALFNIRLDKLLTILNKSISLREAKRLCENSLVFVNNKPQNSAYKITRNCEVKIFNKKSLFDPCSCKLVYQDRDYVLIDKNSCVHTAKVKGAMQSSLEENLALFLPNARYAILLNRLDYGTSGLIVVALTNSARDNWLQAENEQQIEKNYLALAENTLNDCVLNYEFDTKNRRKTLVTISQENSRVTEVTNLYSGYINDLAWEQFGIEKINYSENPKVSLVQVTIYKGARHQIRASLAYNGNPLLYDKLYGASHINENWNFYLHNYAIKSPFFTFSSHSVKF